jgi:hypothetical protein
MAKCKHDFHLRNLLRDVYTYILILIKQSQQHYFIYLKQIVTQPFGYSHALIYALIYIQIKKLFIIPQTRKQFRWEGDMSIGENKNSCYIHTTSSSNFMFACCMSIKFIVICLLSPWKKYISCDIWKKVFFFRLRFKDFNIFFQKLPFWTLFRNSYFLYFIATLALFVPCAGCKKSLRTFNQGCYVCDP